MSGLQFPTGWVDDQPAVEAVLATLPMPVFGSAGAALADSGKGRTVLHYQIARKVRPDGKYPLYLQTAGTCFPAGTLVRMADGSEKPIETIRRGEMVLSHTNTPRKVLDIGERPYNGPVYAVTVKGHTTTLRMTAEHPVAVFPNAKTSGHGYRAGAMTWKAAHELELADRVLLPFGFVEAPPAVLDLADYQPKEDLVRVWKTPLVGEDFVRSKGSPVKCRRYLPVDEAFARLVGLYLAEGSIRRQHNSANAGGVTFTFGGDEEHFADETVALLRRVFEAPARVVKDPKRPTVIRVRCDNKAVGEFFARFCKETSYAKRVPVVFFSASRVVRMSLLRAWLDGDGHVRCDRSPGAERDRLALIAVGVTASRGMHADFCRLAISCGLKPSSTLRKRAAHQRVASSVLGLSGPDVLAVYPERREEYEADGPRMVNPRYGRNEHGFLCAISDIQTTLVSGLQVFNLEVEEEHTYVAGGVAVHNCVSKGFAKGVHNLLCNQIAAGQSGPYPVRAGTPEEIATEDIYAGSRVEIGGGQLRGEGSIGAWAAQYVQKFGILLRRNYGKGMDLSVEDDRIAVAWGRRGAGVPDALEPISRQQLVATFTQCRSYADVRDALANGYPVMPASNIGASRDVRDQDGFLRMNGRWPHCVPGHTLIGARVPKRADQIAVGDLVFGHDGREHPVTNVMTRRFQGEMVRLTLQGGMPLEATPEHPVLVYRPMRRHGVTVRPGTKMAEYAGGKYAALAPQVIEWDATQPEWVDASDVRPGDYVLTPAIDLSGATEIPTWSGVSARCRNVPNPITAPTADLAWFFGLFIGDGDAQPGHRIHLVLSNDGHVERACRVIEALGLRPRVEREETYTRVFADSSVLASSFAEWFGRGSANKLIPAFLFSAGWDRAALLEGLMDADGCVYRERRKFHSTSKALAHQVRLLLVAGGEQPTITTQVRGAGAYPNAKPMYVVEWREPTAKSRMCRWGNFVAYKVTTSLAVPADCVVYDYEVQDSHSFLANGVVVHNCMTWIGVVDDPRRPGVVCDQSWPEGWISGPLGPPELELPPWAFRVDADVVDRVCAQGDTFAISGLGGFIPQDMPNFDQI